MGGLLRRLDVHDAVRVQCRRGRDKDCARDHNGREHARGNVTPHGAHVATIGSRNSLRIARLHLFGRLPKEEVRRDSRSRHGDEQGNVGFGPEEVRNDGIHPHLGPRDLHHKQHGHVRNERQAQPAQKLGVAVIGNQDFERENHHSETHHTQHLWNRENQVERRRHAGKVGRDVDRVGNGHEHHRDVEYRARQARADDAGQTLSGHNG